MNYDNIIKKLRSIGNPENVEGMKRFGINPDNNLGISIYNLRAIAKEIGKNHELALKLWDSGIHDARLLACFIDDPLKITEEQMDNWAKDFDSWDICDQACTSLFDLTPFAFTKIFEWADREEGFVKRGAFSLIAGLTVHNKDIPDKGFEQFYSVIKREACDNRNYVNKSVSWALRNIGKKNLRLNKSSIKIAKKIKKLDCRTAKWIANDVIRELTSKKIRNRIKKV